MKLIATILLLTGLCSAQGTIANGRMVGGQMGAAPGPVALPQNWVNNLEYVGTTTDTITFPVTGTGGTWTCTGVGSFGPYTADSQTSLQQAVNDAESCRTNGTGHPGTTIVIPAGHTYSGSGGITLPQTAGDAVTFTNFIILTSSTPLPAGQTVCSHGIQDNLAQSTQPGIRNVLCDGTQMSYQLGTTVTPVSGAFTLANGTATNTSAYNDVASMYSIQNTGTNQNAIATASWDTNNVGPHHYAILYCNCSPAAGLALTNAPISAGQASETLVSQIPTHIHVAYNYVHGDYTDATVVGGAAITGTQGSNQLPNVIGFLSCIYCSAAYNYTDRALRPGSEGHSIGLPRAQTVKIVHNWFEGESIGHLCGGQQSPVLTQYFVICQDMEDRANRYTYPFSWLQAAAAGLSVNSTLTTTGGGGTGAILNLLSENGRTAALGALSGVSIQAGGSGYAVGNILTPTQTGNSQTNSNATVEVTSVSSGSVTGVEIVSGSGYTAASNLATVVQSPGTGTGLTVNTTVDAGGRIVTAAINTPGTNYTPSDNVFVIQGACTTGAQSNCGLVAIGGVTSGAPTSVLVASGSGYVFNGFGRKNMHEYKGGFRVLNDGNIFENADNTGAQGTSISYKTSAGDPYNFWTQTMNFTITNNIIRNGCNGTSMGDRSDNGPSNGFSVSLQSSQYYYANNLMYDISNNFQQCPGVTGPYGIRIAASNSGSTWAGSNAVEDATGTITTYLLGGAGQGYKIANNLPTVATIGVGTGLLISVTSVNSFGQINGFAIGSSAGTGYNVNDTVTVTQAGTTAAATFTIDAVSGGVPTLIVQGFPNGTAISGFSPSDPVVVTGCSNNAFNTYTTLPFLTFGPRALPGTNPYALAVSVSNTATALSSATGCTVTNLQGAPPYLTATHNSDFTQPITTGPVGDPGSSAKGTAAAPCLLALNNVFTNSITVGGGVFTNPLGEGFRTSNCIYDTTTATYSNTAIPGRDVLVTCPGHTTAGAGGIAACYQQIDNGVTTCTANAGSCNVVGAPTTLYGTITANCMTNNPAGCLGILGNMSASSFNYALPDWHNYRLCHNGDAACAVASPFAAGGANQASDGTDLGADFTKFDPAQTSNKYVCLTACGTGPYADH